MNADEAPQRRSRRRHSSWPEGSDADLAEGSMPWATEEDDTPERPNMPPDAPEADVLEQSESAALDDDDRSR
jgi:hypothetical protein